MKSTVGCLAIAALMLAGGCAGASGGSPIPGAQLSPAARNAGTAARKGRIVVRVKVPKRTHRGGVRSPRYLSPATQSMTLAFTGPTTVPQETLNLTPASPNCSATLSGTSCSYVFSLAPGSYTAMIATYDNVVPAQGKELSAAQAAPFTIVAGAVNTINLSLSGVPMQVVVAPATTASQVTPTGSIDLLGTATRPFIVEALDADGNIIVGPGSPTFSVSQTSGALLLGLGQPTAGAPNAFTVTPPAFSSATATVKATASYAGQVTDGCTQPNAVCNVSVTFDMQNLVAGGGNSGITIYKGASTVPFATITNFANQPSALAFDKTADLFVATCLRGCSNGSSVDSVQMYRPPYTGVPVSIVNGIVGPRTMLFDASGDLFVANCGACFLGLTDSVTEYAPPFTAASTPVATISTGVHDPGALLLDSSNDLFVANCASCVGAGSDTVGEFASPYTGAPTSIGAGSLSGPLGIGLDASSNLYVANDFSNNVVQFAPPYTAVAFTLINGVSSPAALALDPAGDLFVAMGNNKVQVYTTPVSALSNPNPSITSGVQNPHEVALDGANNLYVTNGGNGILGRYGPPYTAAVTQMTGLPGSAVLVAVLP